MFALLGYDWTANEGASNLPNETINDIRTEEGLEDIVSSMHDGDAAPEDQSVGDLAQNNPSSDVDNQAAND